MLIPRTVRAWSSWFGDLRGIAAVPSDAAGSSSALRRRARRRSSRTASRGNPFDDGANLTGRVGADVKMGLGPNLTLEATINPDFGQVEADPAEVNLTAFETRFPERRPFFLEGAPLFNIGHPNFYYSRRIGARPVGPAIGDYVDYPDRHHDSRRRQAHRPAAVEDVDRLPRGRDRRGVGRGGRRRHARGRARRRRAARLLRRGDACCRSSARWAPPPALYRHASCTATSTTATPLANLLAKQCARRRRQHPAALPRRRVRAARRRRRLAGQRRGRRPSSVCSAPVPTSRSDPIARYVAARPDPHVAGRVDGQVNVRPGRAGATGCGAPTPRSTR